jgi:hypothetical protein
VLAIFVVGPVPSGGLKEIHVAAHFYASEILSYYMILKTTQMVFYM